MSGWAGRWIGIALLGSAAFSVAKSDPADPAVPVATPAPAFTVAPAIVEIESTQGNKATNDKFLDVLAGDEFVVKFNFPPDPKVTRQVGFVSAPSQVTPPQVTPLPSVSFAIATIRVKVPREQAAGRYRLVFTDKENPNGSDWMESQSTITVWTLPVPVISEFSPKTIRPGTEVKITGSGFVAPVSQILLTVGGVPARTVRVDPDGHWLVAQVLESEPSTEENWFGLRRMIRPKKGVDVSVWGIPATWPDEMMIQIQRPVRFIWSALLFTAAGLFVAGIIGFIQWI